jgi:bacterioferritin (cytochrome b1)
LSDLQRMSARVPAHLNERALTDEDAAGRATVLNLVKDSLAAELACVLRYQRHHVMIARYLGNDDPDTRLLVEEILAVEEETAGLIRSLAAQLRTRLTFAELPGSQ